VLPELRARIAGQRRLRLWSAGCATGEETYSLAMLLKDAAWPEAASILGTDLASTRLAAARRGRYTAWSMRGVQEPVIARYFERRGKQFILRPDIRNAVDFQVLNLAGQDYPSTATGTDQRDVIFCRNVLIYFDLETIAAIAARLLASLAPGGWLFLGASDPPIAELVECDVELTGAGLVYRPAGTRDGSSRRIVVPAIASAADAASLDIAPPDPAPFDLTPAPFEWTAAPAEADPDTDESFVPSNDSASPRDSYETAYEQGDYDAAAALARAAIDRGDTDEATWIVLVRSLANRGELGAAGEACAAALDRHRLSAELTHLHGMLLAEGGRHTEASIAARRALYLDPQLAVAHLALGDALSRTGETASARRAFTNAEALLTTLAPDTAVPGADGAEASQLLRIARYRIQVLGRAAGPARR
jgi:chemotaxis protein methyltransferase CheR